MAEKEKHSEAAKPKHKKRPHQIITTRAKDGSFGHEHVGEDGKKFFAGTSQDMADLHQHMDDHMSPPEQGQDGGDGTEEAGEQPDQQEQPGE